MIHGENSPIRAPLAAQFSVRIPVVFLGLPPPCQPYLGQIRTSFGSPPRRELQPASQRFPRGRNTRLIRPGGSPERSSPLATSSARESRRRRRHTIRPPSPWHPCAAATATSLHIAVSRSLLCLRRRRGGHARALLHRRCLSPRPPSCSSAPSPSPPSPPLSSVSRVRAPHLLRCSSFQIS